MKLKKSVALSESGFLFNSNTGDSFSLNLIGLKVVRQLNEEKQENEILESLTAEYDIDKDTVERDYREFIQKLMEFNLLTS